MMLHDSLTHILRDARDKDREIRFIDGDKDESTLSFAELWDQAVELLGTLQHRGMAAGDELVIFTESNQEFVVAFWAAILGGIVPVPVAVGISDEHRLKLFRILSQLQRGILYTEPGLRERLLEFAESRDATEIIGKLRQRVVLNNDVSAGLAGQTLAASPEETASWCLVRDEDSTASRDIVEKSTLACAVPILIEPAVWIIFSQRLAIPWRRCPI